MTKISGSYTIENVAGLGTAADGSEICGDPWNPGLDNACDVRNVHSSQDAIVGSAYGLLGTALGTDGAGCNPGRNYTDEGVGWSVGSHLGYLGNDEVGSRLASAFSQTDCGGPSGGTSGGDSGGVWGSGGSSGGSDGGLWGSDGGSSDGFGWF
jgi:hypothetical protein